jgi:DNA-binding GntR family transcriptional regulator
MSDDQLRAIHTAAAAADAASSTPEWSTADDQFHRALYQAAARPRQVEMAMSLRFSLERYWVIYGELPAKRKEWLRDHAQLVRACVKRDAVLARRTLTDHITRAGRFLLDRHEQRVARSRSNTATPQKNARQQRAASRPSSPAR